MLEAFFPSLASSGYQITSPKSDAYNCIAWAASDVHHWWWPVPAEDTFWPPAVPREATLEAFVAAFATLGYEVCQNPDWEPGFEKVALYARESAPTHAARQCPDGRWTSIATASRKLPGPIPYWITSSPEQLAGPPSSRTCAFAVTRATNSKGPKSNHQTP